MKITVFKKARDKKEVINRIELADLAAVIKEYEKIAQAVMKTREIYHLMNPHRQADGQISTNWVGGIKLPRICFAADYFQRKGQLKMMGYNGLVVVEINDLPTYEKAVEVRELAKKLPETLLCFLGGSGKSVKIVCRGELFGGGLPKEEKDILQFHQNIYNAARRAYQNQFGFDIEFLEPRIDRTVYISADPEMGYNAGARPFYADSLPHDMPQPVAISTEEDHLMPGRTITRTYHLNWTFIVDSVLGRYFELPDEDREATLLMRIASMCLDQGIPKAVALGMALHHPVLNRDRMLVEMIFQNVYSVAEQEEWLKKHKMRPLKSVPDDTIQAMKTEIFLNSNYELRKNLLTGVAEYREKFSDDQRFKPLTEEVRNDMTLRATELGMKSWDRDVNRFITRPVLSSSTP